MIIKEAITYADIDFVCKAPAGKEVEELTKKEIHKALRAKIPIEQYKEEHGGAHVEQKPQQQRQEQHKQHSSQRQQNHQRYHQAPRISRELSTQFKRMLEELIGTRGAYLLDKKLNILGKVPVKEIKNILQKYL